MAAEIMRLRNAITTLAQTTPQTMSQASLVAATESSTENPVVTLIKPVTDFVSQSHQLITKCTKPDRKGERFTAARC